MSNTTFMGLSGSGSLILILFKRFEVKVTSQCLHKCNFPCQIAWTGPHRAFVPFLDAQLKLSQRSDMGMDQEQGSAMAALKSRSMNGTVASLKMRRTKSNCFHSSAHRYPRIIWVENSSWVPDLRPCSQTDHVMSQRFSHATIQRQILGFFCTWHMPQNMAMQKHMSAQWTVMSWCWLSGDLSLLAYQSFGWALVHKKISWHSNTYHPLQYRSIKIIGTAPLPQSNRMWHNFTVSWMW